MRVLKGLDVGEPHVPVAQQERATVFGQALARRRMLVVLDNARSAEQVAPLLPPVGPSAVLVTSRSPLSHLAAPRWERVALPSLSAEEGEALLIAGLGADRVRRERDAAQALTDLTGGLPLALALINARAAHVSEGSLGAMLGALGAPGLLLDGFDNLLDARTDVRSVLSWSYELLSDRAQGLFALFVRALGRRRP